MSSSNTTTNNAVSEPKKKRDPPNFSTPGPPDFVTVLVNDEKFIIHKLIVSYHSPFFRMAFASELIEGQTQTMILPEVDTRIFGIFVNWLYTGKLTNAGIEPKPFELFDLGQLWKLGQRCLIPRLQNEAIDLIPRKMNKDNFKEIIALLGWFNMTGTGDCGKLKDLVFWEVFFLIVKLNSTMARKWVSKLPPSLKDYCFLKLIWERQNNKQSRKPASDFYEKEDEELA